MPYVLAGPPQESLALIEPPAPFVLPDLLDDLPPYEQRSYDILGVLRALANELARLEQVRNEIISSYFPNNADRLLHFYEQMLGVAIDPTLLTLLERQQLVLAFMQALKSRGTGLEWEAVISTLIGNTWTYHEHDPNDNTSPPANTILIKLPFSGSATPPAGLTAATF